jgi:GMP synthase (glutamine-hydrolysing)
VTDQLDWSEATADWIRRAMTIQQPLFGVCYGHQLMAYAMGGTVGYHPKGIEIGCLPVRLLPSATQDALVGCLPSHFDAHLTHMQSVLVPPPDAVVFASSVHDPHQILRYGPCAISTQFHPEFSPRIMNACVDGRAEFLHRQGLDLSAIKANSVDTVFSRGLLQRFVRTYLGSATATE